MDFQLFKEEEDYALCEKTLSDSILKYPIRLYSYCIMPNHWHLLIDGDDQISLSRCIQHFSSCHARNYRHRHGSTGKGAVYQNRFRAHPVQRNEAFARVAHYIEYNPVKAGLKVKAQEWRWCSAYPFIGSYLPVTPWPIQKPYDWNSILTQDTQGEWVDRINISLRLQQPLGDLAWVRELNALSETKNQTNTDSELSLS